MKRFHVHVSVGDLAESVRFYSQLFGAEPSVRKGDYAKWMLEDPRVNFALSQRGATPGVQHVGIQVENRAELEEGATTCCYAHSEKSWIADPQGVDSTVYGPDPARFQPAPSSPKPSCCAPSCCSPRAA
jgi:catechol 2,3-dioxygenase-like lactoylglutathione lyase family enzyme